MNSTVAVHEFSILPYCCISMIVFLLYLGEKKRECQTLDLTKFRKAQNEFHKVIISLFILDGSIYERESLRSSVFVFY